MTAHAPAPARPGSAGAIAAGVTAACPGWLAWYDEPGRQWIARRTGNFEQEDGASRVYAVTASSVVLLLREIGGQALLDIAALYPDWEAWPDPAGGSWYAEGPCPGGRCSLGALTGPALLAGITAAVNGREGSSR